MGAPPVPPTFTTTDPEQAAAFLRATYTDHTRLRLTGTGHSFRFEHHLLPDAQQLAAHSGAAHQFHFDHSELPDKQLSLARVAYTWGYEADIAALTDDLVVAHIQAGKLWVYTGGDTELRLGPGDLLLYPWDHGYRVGWDNIDLTLVRIGRTAVTRVAHELTGVEPTKLEFVELTPAVEETATHWLSLTRHLSDEILPRAPVVLSPLIRPAALRLMIASLLETFPNTAVTTRYRTGVIAHTAVRRAVAYIESHAGTAIGLSDIACAARVGPRALQVAFRQHLDTTPLTYLRKVRLDFAHAELRDADPATGATVAAIAARWGFPHHGRFAEVYRRNYGRPPSQTLRGEPATAQRSG